MHKKTILFALLIGVVTGVLFAWKTLIFISIAGVIIFGIMCSRIENHADGLFGLPSPRMLVFFHYILGGLIPFLIGMTVTAFLVHVGIISWSPGPLLHIIFR